MINDYIDAPYILIDKNGICYFYKSIKDFENPVMSQFINGSLENSKLITSSNALYYLNSPIALVNKFTQKIFYSISMIYSPRMRIKFQKISLMTKNLNEIKILFLSYLQGNGILSEIGIDVEKARNKIIQMESTKELVLWYKEIYNGRSEE